MPFAPKHILVPVALDQKEDLNLAEHALHAACDIAEKFESTITLLHLSKNPVLGSAGVDVTGHIYESFQKILENRLNQGKMKLKGLEQEAKNRGITVQGKVVDSIQSTAQVILETASEVEADLLVIGSHGRQGLSKLMFGSTAEAVAKNSAIPVLLLHPQG